jgi:putative MATE family efflux protein
MVLEMAMESLFAICDVFFVSRLGFEAVTAVGLTESMLTLLYAVAVGLAMGTTAMVARRIGEKDPEGAAVAAVQAGAMGLAVAAVVAVPGALFAPDLLELMGAPPEIVRDGAGYPAVMFGGSATILLLFLLNAVFRGAGDAAVAMRVLWLANGLNILLDPCLIFGLGPFPEMGVTGAAVATTIGRGTGVACQLWVLLAGKSRIRIPYARLRVVPKVLFRLLRVSAGGVGQFLIATGSWVGLVRIISLFGSTAVAGYTIAIRIIIFTILPAWGMANAAATLMGQNLGAGQPDRAAASVWRTGLYNMVFLLAVAAAFLTFPEPVVGIFTSDPEVARYAVDCLRFVSYGYGFYAWGMVMVQAFNGAGDTSTPTAINLVCYWVIQIPLAWVLARELGLGARGVFASITIAESLLTVAAILAFRRGRWRTRTI